MTKLSFVKSYDEVDNIKTFVFSSDGTSWLPGQFQEYVLSQAGQADAAKRWFTIASAPSEGEIHISTRLTGSAFKRALDDLQPGDQIEAHGAEGDFLWQDDTEIVMVAAGIGVTPFRSMLVERHNRHLPLNTTLLYYSRDDQFAFEEELDTLLAEHPEFKIEYISGKPITADSILEHAPQAEELVTYVSGPEPMVDAVGDELMAKGVELKQDWFPGYSSETY